MYSVLGVGGEGSLEQRLLQRGSVYADYISVQPVQSGKRSDHFIKHIDYAGTLSSPTTSPKLSSLSCSERGIIKSHCMGEKTEVASAKGKSQNSQQEWSPQVCAWTDRHLGVAVGLRRLLLSEL